jgi:hypothetical protein
MENGVSSRWRVLAGWALVATLGATEAVEAQAVSGHARVVQTSIISPLGITTTVLADTGTLGGSSDAREASIPGGNTGSTVAGKTLHATTIGWPDQVKSEASLAGLTVAVAGLVISADFIMARASKVLGFAASGGVNIDDLLINGILITITGVPNQTVTIPGGRLIINEQSASSTGIVVNALHVAVTGVADIVVASARASVQ